MSLFFIAAIGILTGFLVILVVGLRRSVDSAPAREPVTRPVSQLSRDEFFRLCDRLVTSGMKLSIHDTKRVGRRLEIQAFESRPVVGGTTVIRALYRDPDEPVGSTAVDDLHSRVNYVKADRGVLITNQTFTKEANAAKTLDLELVDGERFQTLLRKPSGVVAH